MRVSQPTTVKEFEALFKTWLARGGESSYSTADFRITLARYTKCQLAVQCTSNGSGYKTRAMRLIGDGLNCRWVGRGNAYIASPRKAARFVVMFAEGWDASAVTGELEPPKLYGQAGYEADLAKRPAYHDGTPRKPWAQLGELERSTWEKPHAAAY